MLDDESAIRSMLDQIQSHRAQFDRAIRTQAEVLHGIAPATQPLLLNAAPDLSAYPSYTPKETHTSPKKMLVQELRGALASALGGRESLPSVRANMGCGIVLSLFGLKQQLFDDKMPWLTEHIEKEALLELQPGEVTETDEFRLAMEQMAYLADRVAGTGVRVYPLDIQGAIDTAHLLMGDAFFYELYDDEAFIDHVIRLCEHAIIYAMEACLQRIPGSAETVAHYSCYAIPRSLGGLKLSEDTSTLLSKKHIEQFAAPSMHRLLTHFGGGYIHCCGKNPHLYQAVLQEPLAIGLNFGNPEMHDMEQVLHDCAMHGKTYLGPVGFETEPNAFRRILHAAEDEKGVRRILLQMNGQAADATRIAEQWEAAASASSFPKPIKEYESE